MIENLNVSKDQRQRLGVDRWNQIRGVGTLEYVTGFGKTRVGLLISDKLISKYPLCKILILTPSSTIQKQWMDNILEFEFTAELHTNFVFLTADEAINQYGEHFDTIFKLLIVDEIHKFTSEERYKLFEKFNYLYILGLTGTYPIGRQKKLLDQYCPVIDRVTEQEALREGWISQFKEYNLKCELTDKDKLRYETFSIPIAETMDLFRGFHKKVVRSDNTLLFKDEYHVIQSCYSGLRTKDLLGHPFYVTAEDVRKIVAAKMEWNVDLDLSTDYGRERDEYWNPINIKTRASNFVDFVHKRNDILINNDVKLEKVLEIFNAFPNTTICFNESTAFASKIGNAINAISQETLHKQLAIVYHSKVESSPIWDEGLNDYFRYGSGQKAGQVKLFGQKTLKDIAVNGLKEGLYKWLITAKALDEGTDVPTIEQVVTTGGSANPTQYEQRKGRGLRLDIYNPNKITKIFNVYFDDFIGSTGNTVHSRDKQKLIAKQRERGSSVIWIDNLCDISE